MPFGRHYSEITVNLKDNTQNNSISSPNPEGMPCMAGVGLRMMVSFLTLPELRSGQHDFACQK